MRCSAMASWRMLLALSSIPAAVVMASAAAVPVFLALALRLAGAGLLVWAMLAAVQKVTVAMTAMLTAVATLLQALQ